jgi:hypothetical protein
MIECCEPKEFSDTIIKFGHNDLNLSLSNSGKQSRPIA